MIPVNSVLQVGFFPEIMKLEIDRRLKVLHLLDVNTLSPYKEVSAIITRSPFPISETLLEKLPPYNSLQFYCIAPFLMTRNYFGTTGFAGSVLPAAAGAGTDCVPC